MVDPELLEILNSFKDEFKGLRNDFKELRNEFKGLENQFKGLQNQFKGLENQFKGLEDQFKGLENQFKELKGEMNTRFAVVEERIDNLQHTCSIIEYEHGKKLNMIFDYIHEDIEKHEQNQYNFNKIDSKLEDHSIRLAILESSGVYKSVLEQMRKENLESST